MATKTRTPEQKSKDAERARNRRAAAKAAETGDALVANAEAQAASVTTEPVGSPSVEAPEAEDRIDNREPAKPKPFTSAVTNQARKIVADNADAKARTYFIWDAGTTAGKADAEWLKVNGLGKAFAKDTQREQPTRGKYTSTKLTPAQAIALAERFEHLAASEDKPGPLRSAAAKLVREAVVNAKK